VVDQISAATNGSNVFGGPKFAVEVEAMIGRRVQRGSPGRPKKSTI
jgi:putative transposase